MIRTYDLALVWTLRNRAWIDKSFRFFAGLDPLWRRDGGADADCLFRFVHDRPAADPLLHRLPSGTEVRVAGTAGNDLVVTVSHVRPDLHEMLSAYEVANRIGAPHAPYAATGLMGSQCRTASVVHRFAHLTDSHVEPLVDNEIVRPELERLHAAQKQQYEHQGYVTTGEQVVFFQDGFDAIPVDAGHFARDALPGPRPRHGTSTGRPRRRPTRTPPRPLVTQLLTARPVWLTPDVGAAAARLRTFVNILQDMGSTATKVNLEDPTRPTAECVALPIYVPMGDEAGGEVAARLQRVMRLAEVAEVRLRRRCSTCKRSSVGTPTCRTTRSVLRARTVLSVAGANAAVAPGAEVDLRQPRIWSCGRCPGAGWEEEIIFVCPFCRGLVSPLDALDRCRGCGLTPD